MNVEVSEDSDVERSSFFFAGDLFGCTLLVGHRLLDLLGRCLRRRVSPRLVRREDCNLFA